MPAPTPTPAGRWFCDACLGRFAQSGDCPGASCDQEPLLDLGDPDVQHILEDADQARMRARLTTVSSIALVPGAILMLVGGWFAGRFGAIPGVFLTAVLITVGMRQWPAREHCPEDIEQVRARVEAERKALEARTGRIPLSAKARPVPTGPTEPCTGCGRPVPTSTALIGEHGLLCARCQGLEEVDALEAQAERERPGPLDLLL